MSTSEKPVPSDPVPSDPDTVSSFPAKPAPQAPLVLEDPPPTSEKPVPSDPVPSDPDTVSSFPAKPAPEAPLVLEDTPPTHGEHGGPASNRPGCGRASSPLKQWCCGWGECLCWSAFFAFVIVAFTCSVYLIPIPEPYPRISVAGLSLSSFGVSTSNLQMNGTWHLNFSVVHKDHMANRYIPYDGAAVSLYYKGAYLAGVDIHTFRVARDHPLPLEVNVDASRRDVPGWLARDLAEVGRVGVMELEVQFVTKHDEESDYYLCGGLSLRFSTPEEAELIGAGPVSCPLIA